MRFGGIQVSEHTHMPGGWCVPTLQDRNFCAWDPSRPCSYTSSSVSFITAFVMEETSICFSEFCEPLKQITKLEEGVMETSDL